MGFDVLLSDGILHAKERDDGPWQWGGNLVIHEVIQQPNGTLTVRVPAEVESHFDRSLLLYPKVKLGTWQIMERTISSEAIDSFSWCQLAEMPEQCELKTMINWDKGTRGLGVILRADDNLDSYYQIRFEPGRQRVVFDRYPRPGDQPFMLERPIDLEHGKEVELKIFIEETVVEIYVNSVVAMSTRAYDYRTGSVGLFVSEGKATFNRTELMVI